VEFSSPIQTGPAAYPASYIMETESFLEVKQPLTGVDHFHPPICAPKSGYNSSRNNNVRLGD
jgi:hypothetical protein